ncbi:unnamed protein product [Somion occarium]|uniref:Small RNA 2'-O-methyltransferase n=1 Tax=Somion occarium TaxID=3059160 RepID=A0ABP1E8T3_9APHY
MLASREEMSLDAIDPNVELNVSFHPPLALQRRGWVFDIMRRERVSEVLDIGCGEGELIACLCNPPPWLRPPPASLLPPTSPLATLPTPHEVDCDGSPMNNNSDADDYLYINKIYALDISSSDLEYAITETAPRPEPEAGSWQRYTPRWGNLDIDLWEGSLDVFNPEFVGIECVVSTEVIEHLPEDILDEFAPVILGLYHPRLLLITTPSFTFNERFVAPNAPPGTRRGYHDPTKRTDRIFRHHDHKFEWTIQEFTQWCRKVAQEWGYDVDIDGVGKALEPDPWGRDEELGFASQVAAFTRREGEEDAGIREQRCKELGLLQRMRDRVQHKLCTQHRHLAHPTSKKPGTLITIGDAVKAKIQYFQEARVVLRQFWFENDISTLCGGWVELLVAAIQEHPDLRLEKSQSESRWFVELPGFVPGKQDVWEEVERESSIPGSIPSESSQWNEEESSWNDQVGNWDAEDKSFEEAEHGWDSAPQDLVKSQGGWGTPNEATPNHLSWGYHTDGWV